MEIKKDLNINSPSFTPINSLDNFKESINNIDNFYNKNILNNKILLNDNYDLFNLRLKATCITNTSLKITSKPFNIYSLNGFGFI